MATQTHLHEELFCTNCKGLLTGSLKVLHKQSGNIQSINGEKNAHLLAQHLP